MTACLRSRSKLQKAFGACALGIFLLGAPVAMAQDSFFGLGVGVAPDYEGSDDYRAIPLAFGRFDLGGSTLALRGLGARLEFPISQRVVAGPAFRFRFGRDGDVDDLRIKQLPNIDDAFELGGFIRYQAPLRGARATQMFAELEVLGDVAGAHDGFLGTFGLGLNSRPSPRLGLALSTNLTFVDDSYADTNFSISPAGAVASGLAPFNADGGLHSIGLSLRADYALTEQWGMSGFLSVQELLNDAADSPIVDTAGSSTQGVAGVGISFRF